MPEHYEITATDHGFFVKQPMPHSTHRYLDGLEAMRVIRRLVRTSPTAYALKPRVQSGQRVYDTVTICNPGRLAQHLSWLALPAH